MSDRSLLNRRVNMKGFAFLYVVLIIFGKILRWTLMKATLINSSKGWGYPYHIINDPLSFQLFGYEEISEGDIGLGSNLYSIFKVLWYLLLKVPESFVEFEVVITIIWGAVLLIIIMRSDTIVSMSSFIFIVLSTMVISVYDLTLGKEPIQMLYFFLLFAVLASNHLTAKSKVIGGILVVLFSAMTFRTYYILILFFAFFFYLALNKMGDESDKSHSRLRVINLIQLFLWMCFIYFAVIVLLRFVKGDLFVRMRDALLAGSDATMSANTFIDNKIADRTATNPFMITLEYALACIRILFPVELIRLGPKYWPYVLYQLIMTAFLISGIKNYHKSGRVQKFAVVIFAGYVFCSACFETDFGSWVRHNSTTFPLMLIVSGIVNTDTEEKVVNDIGIEKTNCIRPIQSLPEQ